MWVAAFFIAWFIAAAGFLAVACRKDNPWEIEVRE